ncbi:MAG TPA: iron ABC transporter permease [Streptosporangiaceae bacterium]|nr:iron ABC transporter permease [Streptosporangiaceae bacterium]
MTATRPKAGRTAGGAARAAAGRPAEARALAADAASGVPAGLRPAGTPDRSRLRADAANPVTIRRSRPGRAVAVASVLLLIAVTVGAAVGPAELSPLQVLDAIATRLPWHPHLAVSALDSAIVWQIRLPRVVLGVLVGSMLAGGGAAYQGVFRNPLADPYLLGVAAGAGLGATIVVVSGGNPALTPPAAFAGAVGAVALTYLLGARVGRGGESPVTRGGTSSILLAGIAVAALLTAFQTYLQQQHTQTLAYVYAWILGGLSAATWSDVWLILPYVIVAAAALLVHRRLLDVLRVGETEATSLGVNVARLRLTIVMAATLGVAAAVSVSGLIGFVGIIVPHAVRLTAGPSYRVLLPVSMIGGAAFLVLADVVARTAQAPAEVPIGVITALIGAPFFLFVLRSRRARQAES